VNVAATWLLFQSGLSAMVAWVTEEWGVWQKTHTWSTLVDLSAAALNVAVLPLERSCFVLVTLSAAKTATAPPSTITARTAPSFFIPLPP
jgi:hypothetical protein